MKLVFRFCVLVLLFDGGFYCIGKCDDVDVNWKIE